MRRIINSLAVFTITCSFFACSKKVQTFHFGKPYYDNSTQTVTTQNTQEEIITEEVITTSTQNENLQVIENNKKYNTEAIKSSLNKIENTTDNKSVEKPTFKQKVAAKIINKKIEKMQRGGMSANMKLGIIIAAVSLVVLIVVAAGLLGGLSGLFWLLGGLGLLAGLLIILLAALDVI